VVERREQDFQTLMAIDRDTIAAALATDSDRIVIDKASIANAVAGQLFSMWRATGQPAQAAIPAAAAVPTSALLGAIAFANQTAPKSNYFAWGFLTPSNGAMACEFHDRIAHIGGLVLNVTTAQTVTGLDLSTLAPSSARLGESNYSDVQWFLEVYTDGGATASNATIAVTYNDATTGNLNVVAVGGTLRAGRMIALTPFIPTGSQGKFIRAITSVTLSVSTGTAGNFGFTCTRQRTVIEQPVANKTEVRTWQQLGLPEVPNDSCIFMVVSCGTTSTGTLRGGGKLAHLTP
jgi:hypothetical protein